MKKIAVFLANGFEEIEAFTVVDVMRRAGAQVDTVSVCGDIVEGAHGIKAFADITEEQFDRSRYDALVLPGGMPGAKILGECKTVLDAVSAFDAAHKIIAAICAAPAVVLGMNGYAAGRKVTCYPAPAFINVLEGAEYTCEEVTTDGNLITASGPKAAMAFAEEICRVMEIKPAF